MRVLVTFFILLCFHLTGATVFACTGSYTAKNVSYSRSIRQKPQSLTTSQARAFVQNLDLTGQNDDPTFIEDEDDDDNIVRRGVVLPDCFSTFLHNFITTFAFRNLTGPILRATHLPGFSSPKYIQQRTLRI